MKQCPLCGSEVTDPTSMCDCGYDFEKKEVADWTRTCMWINQPGLGWPEEVRRKKSVHELQVKRYGPKIPRSLDAPGWTQKKTADMLNESPANLCRDLKLAKALDTHPDLSKIEKKSKAMKRLKEIKTGMPAKDDTSFESEDELQNYLLHNWGETPLAGEWDIYDRYRKGKFDTGEVGIIDLLAKHKTEPKWLIIELKKWNNQVIRWLVKSCDTWDGLNAILLVTRK